MYNFLYVQLYKIFRYMAKKVLIIDDSPEDAKAVSGVFEKSGINIVHLNDALDAMDAIYKEVPD